MADPTPTTPNSTDFTLGEHQSSITLILASQARMEAAITGIQQTLAEQRGERKVAVWLAGVVGSALTWMVQHGAAILTVLSGAHPHG